MGGWGQEKEEGKWDKGEGGEEEEGTGSQANLVQCCTFTAQYTNR